MDSTASPSQTHSPSTSHTLHDQLMASRFRARQRMSLARQRLIAMLLGSGVLLLLLLFIVGNVLYTRNYEGRVYRGVRVAGVPLGGLPREAARARLDERVAAYAARPASVGVKKGEQRWELAPMELSVQVDTTSAVDQALAVGRAGGLVGNAFDRLGALLTRRNLAPPVVLDESRLEAVLAAWAPDVTYWPTNARFVPAPAGGLAIEPEKAGLGIDIDRSRDVFLRHSARLATTPITLVQTSVPAPITRQMLQEVQPQAAALAAEPLAVRLNDKTWLLSAEDVRIALVYRLKQDQLVPGLDPRRLEPFLLEISRAVSQPGANAKIVVNPRGRYAIQPGTDGLVLDLPATTAAIDTALAAGGHDATVVLKAQAPPIVAADLEPARARAEQIAAMPLTVTFAEYSRVFTREEIQPLLSFKEQPDKPEKVAIVLDQAGLRAMTQVLALDLNQGVRNAQFRWVDQSVQDIITSRDGREVQFAATDAALSQAILGATGTATPNVAVTEPTVKSSQKADMVITDRLGYGRTNYSGGSPRAYNLELATERLDGALIPPDAVFSFNQTVGEQTVANGYKESYGIVLVGGSGGGSGQVRTVTSIGGGICQVSTTLFHGIFRAGLPIEERNWHLYWISYGAQGTGMQGLDATVDDQGGVDFRFKNTTGGWLAIEAVADGSSVRIAIYGKDPGWNVIVDEPIISNIEKADPKLVEEKTHDLPPGERRSIEVATDGFTAEIRRRVLDRRGVVLLDTTFKSDYRPSRNVVQVGVPKDEPLTPSAND